MTEMIMEYFQPALLLQSSLLILIVLYWIVAICGVIGLDAFDIEFDIDLDVDADVGGFSFSGNILRPFLEFFYVGEVPIMILLSFFGLSWWLISITVVRALPEDWGSGLTFAMMIPAAVGSLLICKVILYPIHPWLGGVGVQSIDTTPIELIGIKGIVNTSEVTDSFGRVLIYREDSDLIMDARCRPGDRLRSGDVVEIVDYDQEIKAVIIQPFAEK